MTMTNDEIRRTKEYREGWNAFVGHKPTMASPKNPYKQPIDYYAEGPFKFWLHGAHSCYGNSWEGMPPYSHPLDPLPTMTQMELFE